MLVLLRMPVVMSDWERATPQMRTCSEVQFQLHKPGKTSADHCSQRPGAAATYPGQRCRQPQAEQRLDNMTLNANNHVVQAPPHPSSHSKPAQRLHSLHSSPAYGTANLPELNRKHASRQLYLSQRPIRQAEALKSEQGAACHLLAAKHQGTTGLQGRCLVGLNLHRAAQRITSWDFQGLVFGTS